MSKAPRHREPARQATPKRMEDEDTLRRRGIYEKAKLFEERVAELFGLLGYRTILDYLRDEMQFDIRLEMAHMALPTYALVECKDLGEPVTQAQVREFASKVATLRETEKKPYQAIMIARSGFANNAHAVAQTKLVHLLTFQQLLLSLIDLQPNLETAIRSFEGTPLQRLYVEQEAVLEAEIRPGEVLEPKGLAKTALEWLDRPTSTFLALLGDFGCGKSSFCKRLAWELATKSKEKPSEVRIPILVDLRESGSTTVTLENLLTHHFQRLSSQPLNPQALLHLNREGYLLLIFDGFDETIAYTEPSRYIENLRQVLRAAEGKAKVLLTCRTHYFRDRPEALKRLGRAPEMVSSPGATKLYEEIQERPGVEIGYVLEFRESQIEEYLKKALPPLVDWKIFREQIKDTYNLEELARSPFLLKIIVKTLPRLLERGTEINLSGLYETYCQNWFDHTDFRLTLTREHKVALVEYLACLIWNSPENRVYYTVLADKAAEFFKNRPLTAYDKEQIDYEVRTALFLHRDPEGYYSFVHRSFLEFFIARTLRDGLSKGDSNCLNLKRITREVAFFLGFWPEAEREIEEFTSKILEADYQGGISENALLLLYFHAQATLRPLVGSGSEAEDLPKIRKIFSGLRLKNMNLVGADLEDARLPGIDLSGANLEGAKLARADLRRASLDRARLGKAFLGFVDFRQGSAIEADLSGADLNHLDAQKASFKTANLRGVDLVFSRLTGADFSGAKLEGARILGAGFLDAAVSSELVYPVSAGPPRVRNLDLHLLVGHASEINSVAWSPDGTCLATGSYDGTIKIWDTENGRLIKSLLGHEGWVRVVTWAPDGGRIASGSSDHTLRIWDVTGGRLIKSLQGHESSVFSVSWAPDGQRIASGSSDSTLRIWDVESGQFLKSFQEHDGSVFSVAWAPDGRRIASGSSDNTVRLWDAESGQLVQLLKGHKDSVLAVAWAPDGRQIASGSRDYTVGLWEAESGRLLKSLQGHEGAVRTVAWAPDGQRIASGSSGHTVRLWDAGSGRLLKSLQGYEDWILSIAWAPDGRQIASGSSDNAVRLWDTESGRLLKSLQGHKNSALSAAWAPDGRRIISGSSDNTVRLWDVESGRLLNSLQGHGSLVLSVAWAPDGRRIASGSSDNTVRLWDSESGRLLNSLQEHESPVLSVAWAPDGRQIASGSSDNTVRLWDSESGRLLKSLQGHESSVLSVAWAPDGRQIASGSRDNTLRLWDTGSGQLVKSLQGHKDWVRVVAWAPDGQRIASGSRDNTLRLWDAESGKCLRSLLGHEKSVLTVAWTPDRRWIASGSYDQTVRLWDVETGKELDLFKISGTANSFLWTTNSPPLVLTLRHDFQEIWDLASNPPCPLVRLYNTPGSGFAATPDGYVSGPPEALEYVRFGDGWALYDLTDVPERLSPERVAAALNPVRPPAPRRRGGTKGKG